MKKILVGVAILGLLLMMLLGLPIMVLMSQGAANNANTCVDGLQPVGDGTKGPETAPDGAVTVPISPQGPQKSEAWSQVQLNFAATITAVARTKKLQPRAAVIAVAAAMAHSRLDPAGKGSVGLYDVPIAAPSAGGWGSAEQVADPIAATTTFYAKLVEVKDWQTAPIGKVVHAVIRTDGGLNGGNPEALYASWEQAAGGLVTTAWGNRAVPSVSVGCAGASGNRGVSGEVPAQFRDWILKAGSLCPEAPPHLIAAQIFRESSWDPNIVQKTSGAQGLSQFMPGTWPEWGVDSDGNGRVSPFDPGDAIMAQGRYDCAIAEQMKGWKIPGDIQDLMLAGYNAGPYAVKAAGGVPNNGESPEYIKAIRALMPKFMGKPTAAGGSDPQENFGDLGNPRTAWQAIAAARRAQGSSGWYRMCDNFVAQAYGWGSSGSYSALTHWDSLVARGVAHPGDAAPPPGALLFYDNAGPYGHVTLYLGGDQVASNDIKGASLIAITARGDVTDGTWNLRYKGWADPVFPGAGGTSRI